MWVLKSSTEGEDLMWRGRSVQSLGATREKAQLPLDFIGDVGMSG